MIVICLGMFTASATAVQVNLKPKMVSVGTQNSISPQTSTPLASPEQTVDDDDDNATVISRGCPKSRWMRRNCLMRSHLTRVTPTTSEII